MWPRWPMIRLWRWMRLLASYLGTLAFVVTVNFMLPRTLPGDPIDALLATGEDTGTITETTRTSLNAYYGLDRPLVEQFVDYLGALARGDLGSSIRYRTPVSEIVAQRMPWTLLLAGTALALALVIGLVAGVHSGWRSGRPIDKGFASSFMVVQSLPPFFTATLGVYLLAVQLGWFPLSGAETVFVEMSTLERVLDVAHHLVLPAAVLMIGMAAGHYLLMRAGMVGEAGADYLLLGRAKGLTERRLKYRYAARNAVLPVVTLTAFEVGFAVSGSIFIETVFAYPGMGRLVFDAVGTRDYPVLQACFLIFGVTIVTTNFVMELLYGRLDPRVAT